MLYGVINMDIVNSRALENRDALLMELKEFFSSVENKYKGIFVAPITITLGDEWQIVLNDIGELYNIYTLIRNFLSYRGVEVYGGIGIGTISTAESSDTREMDGEAFINGREALNVAKSNKNFYSKKLYTRDCRVTLISSNKVSNDLAIKEVAITTLEEGPSKVEMINTLIQNNEIIENKYTKKQMEIIALYEKYESYGAIEKELNIDKSGVSRKLNTSNYFLTLHNKNMIKGLLRELNRERKYGV